VAFEQAVEFARSLGKPVVVLKTGRSEVSKKIVVSHTSSLAGSDVLIDALFRRIGVARVNSLEDLVEALKVLHVLGPLKGGRIGIMSTSGGDLSLASDAMSYLKLTMPALSEEGEQRIRSTVHERAVVSNPFDYQMFDWNDEARLFEIYTAFLTENFDLAICILDYPRGDKCNTTTWLGAERAFIKAAHSTGAAATLLATFSDTLPEPLADQLVEDGIVPLAGTDTGLAGIQAAVDIGSARSRPLNRPLLKGFEPAKDTSVRVCDEAEAKQFLAGHGVSIPDSRVVENQTEALAAALEIGFPVVVKTLGVAHKTDLGGVILNLTTADAVSKAADRLLQQSQHLLVEKMIDGVLAELIVGVARDEQFGPYVVVGSGGIFVELMKDSRSLLLPVTREQVLDALESLKFAPLFHGFRGKPHCDLEAATDVVMAIATLVEEQPALIAELDINPLMLLAQGHGAVAGDALISMYE
jgi:acyl-CoA synthetase (NDP forming)